MPSRRFLRKTLLAPDVTYSFYPVYARLFGVDYRTVPLREDFTVDTDGLMQGPPVALANPNAPTGLWLDKVEIRRLAAHTRASGAVLLVDEAYAAFAPETCCDLLAEFDNLLLVRTFSKSHSLACMRVGYALGSPRLISALRRIRDSFNSYPLDRLAQAAATASVLDEDYTAACVAKVIAARNKAYARLRAAGITVLESATNFLFVRAAQEDAAPVQHARRERGILVRHFSAPRLKGWLRVTVGTAEDMERVTDALIELMRG